MLGHSHDLKKLLKGGVRGKYVERFREGTNLVLLEPDVAKAFPDAQAVNEALRLVIQLTEIRKNHSSWLTRHWCSFQETRPSTYAKCKRSALRRKALTHTLYCARRVRDTNSAPRRRFLPCRSIYLANFQFPASA